LAKEEIAKVSAQELVKRNMAWVPKGSTQNKNDMHVANARSVAKVKKEKSECYE
jgi:hypothetical protein